VILQDNYIQKGIATVPTAGDRYSAGAKDFFVLHNIQTGSGATQPPIKWVIDVLSLGVKRQGREAANSPPFSPEVKNNGNIYLLLHKSSWRSAYLLRRR
jgi:hypothetical protein